MAKNPSTSRVLFHVILTFLTGGLWLIWLLVRKLLQK